MTRPALFLGREREVAEFCDALSAAAEGSPQIVLVGGDAGIGKTTLVRHVVRAPPSSGSPWPWVTVSTSRPTSRSPRWSRRCATLLAGSRTSSPGRRRGGCSPCWTRGTPTAPEPFRRAGRPAADRARGRRRRPVAARCSRTCTGRTARPRTSPSRSARTARGRLLFVLTFRSDDLHRRHPFRKAWPRSAASPGPGASTSAAAGPRPASPASWLPMRAAQPSPSLVRSCSRGRRATRCTPRSSWPPTRTAIPDQLSDLFLARIDALDEGPRTLLRSPRSTGRGWTPRRSPSWRARPGQLDGYLRELLDANVLRQAGRLPGVPARLLREAVYDDLLPDERTRLHARARRPSSRRGSTRTRARAVTLLSRLAFHWSAAHDLPRALAASVRAGHGGRSRIGAAEALTQLERALSLWDRVPDAEALAGRTKVELVVSWQGRCCDQE